jgi:predicted small lipoprotein YifL
MKKRLLTLTILSCLFFTGCGPQGNTVVAPTDNELTAEEAKGQEEDNQMREDYESGGDRD